MSLHNRISALKRGFVRAVNALFPKNSRKVFFASIPDFADNARAMYDYMATCGEYSGWQFVWLVSRDFAAPDLPGVTFIRQPASNWGLDYYRYLYHVFTSKYLFCTHSHFAEANPRRQVSVCLWHGTMLKRICAMNEREKDQPKKDQFRYFVAPSEFYVDFFCKSFLCGREQVLVTGYPRIDFLLQESDVLSSLGIKRTEFDKIIVYMPTFRKPVGGGYSDAGGGVQSCIDIDNPDTVARLSAFLRQIRCLMLIKWHPADVRRSSRIEADSMVPISDEMLVKRGLTVYHLLHESDALITDYSSVFCDYLVLDRPIAFDIADMESYAEKRGFVFDKPLDYMPGMKLRSEMDFMAFCKDLIEGRDVYRAERERVRTVFNDFSDGRNARRLATRLKIL